MLGLGNTLSGGIVPAAAAFNNNYSVSFDGTDDYLTMGDVTILDGQDTFTISTWFNVDTFPASGYRILFISKDEAYELYMKISGLGLPYFYLRLNNGSVSNTDTVSLSTDTWYHIAAVHNSGGTDIYLNGSALAEGLGSQTTINNTSTPLTLGSRAGSYTYAFTGLIDEVAIFDEALDSSAIAAIYNSGTPTDLSGESNLVGYWRMEEGTGTTVADGSSNSNTGTLTNSPAWSSDTP